MNNLTPTNKGTYKFRTANPATIRAGETVEGWEIEVYYDKGGMNMFSGNTETRGIHAMITPVTHERSEWQGDGQCSTSMLLGDSRAVRGLLLPLNAKSDKKLAAFAEQVDSAIPEAAQVLADSGSSRKAFEVIQAANVLTIKSGLVNIRSCRRKQSQAERRWRFV